MCGRRLAFGVCLLTTLALAPAGAGAQQLAPAGGLFSDWTQLLASPDPPTLLPAEQARLDQVTAGERARVAALETPAQVTSRVGTRNDFTGLTRAEARAADLRAFPAGF